MNRTLTPRQLIPYIVATAGIIFAWYSGGFIADENYLPIAAVLGFFVFITIYFSLGTSLYYLIPIFWGLTGSISMLPVPFSVRQLLVIMASLVFIFSYIFKTYKKIKAPWQTVDFWIFVNLAWLATVFFRNPVGFAAIGGGGKVGGKPYLDVILACMAYLILSRCRISAAFSKKLPYWMLGSVIFTAFAQGTAALFPSFSMKLAGFYNDFNSVMNGTGLEDMTVGETRLTFLAGLGAGLILIVVSKFDPSDLLRVDRLAQSFTYFSGLTMVLLSGFRNLLIAAVLYTGVATILRERLDTLIKIIILGGGIMMIVVGLSYTDIQIPLTFQRALTFLPGHWDENIVLDAKGSSEWRFEMWKIALTSDKYIHSKAFGDGFGFDRADYETGVNQILDRNASGFGGENAAQEAFMRNGDFHSGPVSTIRFVGYVGLLLFLPLVFTIAVYGYRIVQMAKGTPFEFCVFYLTIPVLLGPLFFIFIFGDYRSDFENILFNTGMLNMVYLSIKKHKAEIGL